MAPAIHARSLSTLTELAANPPLQPADSSVVDGPLVLYIARIPGSKDVFLTTMKPLQKVVTAQDVESSLYYFHANNADDDDIRDSIRCEDRSADGPVTSEEYPAEYSGPHEEVKGISRKPLPPNPRLALGTRPAPPPKVYPHFQSPYCYARSSGTPVINGGPQGAFQPSENAHPLPQQRLFGPRPMHNRIQSMDTPGTHLSAGKENVNPQRWPEQPPSVPPQPVELLGYNGMYNCPRPVNRYTDLHPKYKTPWERLQSAIAPDKDLTITVIRRDPYSSGQWNVGKLTIDKNTSLRPDGSKTDSGVLLEMTSPGYDKFRERKQENGGASRNSVDSRSSNHSNETTDSSQVPDSATYFHRFLALKRPKQQQQQQLISPPPLKGIQRKPLQSGTATNSLPLPELSPTYPKTFTFTSPWGGTCEFSTGIAGNSLKLKHTRPTPTPIPTSTPTTTPWSAPTAISELRFNLPSVRLFGLTSPSRPSPAAAASTRRASWYHSVSTGNGIVGDGGGDGDGDDNDDGDDGDDGWDADHRLDLSLGRERAGGGATGKKAKLGKLIVEGDGLQMLDLVVAANMAVWWSVYERGA